MARLEIRENGDPAIFRALFREYSRIPDAEECFVSLEQELADLPAFYEGGALLLGIENGEPAACIAIRRIDDTVCEAKRLFVRPAFRRRGYGRLMLEAALEKTRALHFRELVFTTKPAAMETAYAMYRRMGFQETAEENGIVTMRMPL